MWWARLLNVISGLLAGGVAASTNSYESIQTYTVGAGGQASISFSSIPSTYKHLQIRSLGRTDRAATTDNLKITINSDSGSNYFLSHFILGDGASASAGNDGAGTYALNYRLTGASAASSIFGAVITDILDYTSTNKAKTIRALGAQDRNGAGEIFFSSALWNPSTPAAITSITLAPLIGSNFVQYSSFALYGIKG